MSNLMIDKMFENKNVEILQLDGNFYFNVNQVGNVLGLPNLRRNTQRYNEYEKKLISNSDIKTYSNETLRKLNNAGELFLTESGLYRAIFKSIRPNAKKFQKWVFSEVLPDIRKQSQLFTVEKIVRKLYSIYDSAQDTEIEKDSVVYFIKAGSFVKIGTTTNIMNRLKKMQTDNPKKLSILKVEAGSFKREAELHLKFASDNIRGEWFRMSTVIEDYILSKGNNK